MKLLTAVLIFIFVPMSFAQATTEVWKGAGSILTVTGDVVSTYGVEIYTTQDGSKIDIKTVFLYTDGSSKTVMQKMDFGTSANAFSLVSDLGVGSGACYGDGLCQMYVTDGFGHTYATFSRQDQASMQHLTNELVGNVVVNVFREQLARVR